VGAHCINRKSAIENPQSSGQWQPQPPPPQQWPPPPDFLPAELSAAPAAANVENFLSSLLEPQWGHFVPVHLDERTKTSLSFPHFSQ
jgi:hypothetical protein